MFFNHRPKRRRSRSQAAGGGLLGWLRPAGLVGLLAVTGGSGGVLHLPALSTASAQQQGQPNQPQPFGQQQVPPQQGPGQQYYQPPQYQQPPIQQQPNPQTPFQQPPAQQRPLQQPPVQPPGMQQPQQMVQPAAAVKEFPLDPALALVRQAQNAYGMVHSYQCTMISQERVNGKILPEAVMQLSFRKQPYSVYMKWLAPQKDVNQEVLYVFGQSQNRMQVLPAGPFKSLVGWTNIDVNDPRVASNSNHRINETGFGNLIERCTKCWETERAMDMTKVNIAEFEYNKRRCIRVETWHTQRQRVFYCFRNVVYFDNETRLPVRMECYDWPQTNGPQGGELMECFSYIDITFNQVPDAMFAQRK